MALPEFFWRARQPARILGFSASQHAEITQKIEGFLTYTQRHKTFSKVVEFNTLPVRLANAKFKKSFVTANGRGLLSGASGMRLQNRYLWANEDKGFDPEQRISDYFERCQQQNGTRLFAEPEAVPDGLPYAVECRNTFNYYHFLTESLCQLCSLDAIGHNRPIFLHFPNQVEKTRPFTRAFVDTLFPELDGRVQFERAPKSYDQVLAAYNLMNSYYHYGDAAVPSVDGLIQSNAMWKGRVASRASQGVLAMNAVDTNLLRLRERGLRAIDGMDFSHLPKRFWVGREEGLSRNRMMQGEQEILEMLGLFGFQRVTFESMTPIEQIGLMANAEVMVSYHGAGFTNMLFANPKAHVIELGTLQTAVYRWGDFWRLANVSGATYVNFFADFAKENPLTEPDFAEDGIVPVDLSRHGLAVVMSFLVALVGHIPTYTRPEDVLRLARQLNQIGAPDRTVALMEKHKGVEMGHVGLCAALVEAHRLRGDGGAELAALRSLHEADPQRPYPLLQIVWGAQKQADRGALLYGLDRLRKLFPQKYEELVKDRPWMRRLA